LGSTSDAPWSYLGGGALIGGGAVLLLAAKKRFRGGWPFVIGVLCLVFALAGLTAEVQIRSSDSTRKSGKAAAAIAVSVLCGTLLLHSARKLDRALAECEKLRGVAK
jgi:hypothetical protein